MPHTVPNRPMKVGEQLQQQTIFDAAVDHGHLGHALAQGAAHVVHHDLAAVAGFLGAVELHHALMGHEIERGRTVGAQGEHGLTQAGGLLEQVGALQGLAVGGVEGQGFLDHHAPAAHGHEHQDAQHDLGHETGLADHRKETELHVSLLEMENGVPGWILHLPDTPWQVSEKRETPKSPCHPATRKTTAVRGVEPPGECNVRRLFSSVFSVSTGRTAAGSAVSRPSPHRTSCARGY